MWKPIWPLNSQQNLISFFSVDSSNSHFHIRPWIWRAICVSFLRKSITTLFNSNFHEDFYHLKNKEMKKKIVKWQNRKKYQSVIWRDIFSLLILKLKKKFVKITMSAILNLAFCVVTLYRTIRDPSRLAECTAKNLHDDGIKLLHWTFGSLHDFFSIIWRLQKKNYQSIILFKKKIKGIINKFLTFFSFGTLPEIINKFMKTTSFHCINTLLVI